MLRHAGIRGSVFDRPLLCTFFPSVPRFSLNFCSFDPQLFSSGSEFEADISASPLEGLADTAGFVGTKDPDGISGPSPRIALSGTQ